MTMAAMVKIMVGGAERLRDDEREMRNGIKTMSRE